MFGPIVFARSDGDRLRIDQASSYCRLPACSSFSRVQHQPTTGWQPVVLSLRLLAAALFPVGEKLGLTFIGQRVIEQLIDHLEGHRGDVSAQARRFDHMNGIS